MRLSFAPLAVVLITLLHRVSGQNIVPTSSSSSFPGCALSCTALLQAQSLCVPPTAATTNQITYENCFCQSSLLQALYSTPDAICAAECTIEADRQQLQTWFTGFCAQVGKGIDPLASTATTSPTSTTVVTVTSYSTSPSQATNTGTGSASAVGSSSHQSWIHGHWQWILMVGILAVGFALLTWLAIWWKRRHERKLEERRAAISGFPTPSEKREGARAATPDLWGPHQHMDYTKGWEYSDGPGAIGRGALGVAAAGNPGNRTSELSSSKDRRYHNQSEMTDNNSRPLASRRQSSKGKARVMYDAVELDSEVGKTETSRSSSQPRRGPDGDFERNRR